MRSPVPTPALPALILSILLFAGCASLDGRTRDYDRLVADLETGRSADWDVINTAFLRLPDFQQRLEELGALHERGSGRAQQPAELAERMLALYYGDLRAHELRHRAALAEGETAHAARHDRAGKAIAAAIAASGDGSAAAPYHVLSAPQAYAWLEQQRSKIVGAFYETDDAAPSLLLVTRVRDQGARLMEERRFDLTPTFLAAATLAAAVGGGEGLTPSQVVTTRAATGDAAAQTSRAIELWQRGPEHASRALQWLQAASGAGNLVAREMLGVIYGSLAAARTGEEAERLLEAAVDQLLLAVNQGSSSAMYNLAQLYLSGHFGEENQPSGVALLEQAAARENLDAAVMLARLRYDGQLVAKDRDTAVALLIKASEQGHTGARLLYARHLLGTDDGAGFDERAYRWLEDTAEAGRSTEAMMLLGILHADSARAERDAGRAVFWFKRAAEGSRDADLVNSVAWILVVAEDRALRDAPAGLTLMDRLMNADKIAAGNPAYLDTWAAAHAAVGDFERAALLQRKALAIAEAEAAKRGEPPAYLPVLRTHLELFESGRTISEDVP